MDLMDVLGPGPVAAAMQRTSGIGRVALMELLFDRGGENRRRRSSLDGPPPLTHPLSADPVLHL